MITRLRFKNWRSLKDVTIENLTPITVFIGENASGKTNIVDGLRFLRDTIATDTSLYDSLMRWGGYKKVHTLVNSVNGGEQDTMEWEYSLTLPGGSEVTQIIRAEFKNHDDSGMIITSPLYEGTTLLLDYPPIELPFKGSTQAFAFVANEDFDRGRALSDYLQIFVGRRWQILAELFKPELTSSDEPISGSIYQIDLYTKNLPALLNVMHKTRFDLYKSLVDDTRWLLDYIDDIEVKQTDQRTKIVLKDRTFPDADEMPTVPAGASRLLAMLTTFYLLEMDLSPFQQLREKVFEDLKMPVAHMPGLVVIEEPDTALNPGLLRKFVGLLRKYTEDAEHPRQVMLTTHNPAFLDYFQPEEVRIVERDENGYTQVKQISEELKNIWFKDDEYRVGQVWERNALGGLAE
jgi:AAA15 family ATPase/GTPase